MWSVDVGWQQLGQRRNPLFRFWMSESFAGPWVGFIQAQGKIKDSLCKGNIQQGTWSVCFHVKVHGRGGDGAKMTGSADGPGNVGLVQCERVVCLLRSVWPSLLRRWAPHGGSQTLKEKVEWADPRGGPEGLIRAMGRFLPDFAVRRALCLWYLIWSSPCREGWLLLYPYCWSGNGIQFR